MSSILGRSMAAFLLRASTLCRLQLSTLAAFLLPILLMATPGHAVIVRGVVTDPLGKPVPGARIQLILEQKPVAVGVAGLDGSYEIRSTEAGRFVLLTSSTTFYPGISADFYGGSTDEITQNIVLQGASVHEDVTVTATGLPTPIAQTSSAVTLLREGDLATKLGVVDMLRQSAGVDVVQTGQAGGITSLFVRGGNSTANQVLIDGIPADDVGGTFDFGTVSSTGLAGLELYRGPNSALYGTDAGASVVNLATPRGSSSRPVLNYSGDAGNFHSYRNEAALSGTHQKLDYFAAFSRFDTSNALPRDEYHSATAVANLGYSITANTQARFTIRNADSATGLPGAHDFYGISANGKQGDQDLYSGLTLENRIESGWHNLVRYGIARKRDQEKQFSNVGTPITYNFGSVPCSAPTADCFTEYFGNVVTIRGANGYTATGQASFFLPTDNQDSNRDELYYQSDYSFARWLTALFGFRYENERGSYVSAFANESLQRRNFEYTLQFQGDIKNRLFYSAGGGIEKNHLYGITGTPRAGISYAPVRPSTEWFHGTLLRINAATGVQEPTLGIQFASLYTQLLQAGDTADIAKYHVMPAGPQRSRTYDGGVDQNIKGEKLILKVDYYRSTFNHQLEGVDAGALVQIFKYSPNVANNVFTPYINSLAFRAQGIETELKWQPTARLLVRGGYTYLDAVVTQSFSSDAYNDGTFNNNPSFPGIAIGAEGPLIGARPFRRPPHTGFFAVQYTGPKLGAALKGSMASRSDDSTFLDGFDTNFGNSLVLPNRDLDFGYTKLDANLTYVVKSRYTVFTELDNLLGQQHIGPIGYPALPFTVRAGLKIRIGGE
jgi:iron complex outermembrane receptor protein/vitamin B12 transporter